MVLTVNVNYRPGDSVFSLSAADIILQLCFPGFGVDRNDPYSNLPAKKSCDRSGDMSIIYVAIMVNVSSIFVNPAKGGFCVSIWFVYAFSM